MGSRIGCGDPMWVCSGAANTGPERGVCCRCRPRPHPRPRPRVPKHMGDTWVKWGANFLGALRGGRNPKGALVAVSTAKRDPKPFALLTPKGFLGPRVPLLTLEAALGVLGQPHGHGQADAGGAAGDEDGAGCGAGHGCAGLESKGSYGIRTRRHVAAGSASPSP